MRGLGDGSGAVIQNFDLNRGPQYDGLQPKRSLWKVNEEGSQLSNYCLNAIKEEIPVIYPLTVMNEITMKPVRKRYSFNRIRVPRSADLIYDCELVLMVKGFTTFIPTIVPGLPRWVRRDIVANDVRNGSDRAWNKFWAAMNIVVDQGFFAVGDGKNANVRLVDAEWTVGNARVEKVYGEHLRYLLGRKYEPKNYGETKILIDEETVEECTEIRVPLGFHFTRKTQRALPVISLQYHEVEFSANIDVPLEWEVSRAFFDIGGVCLDAEERLIFARSEHSYKVSQSSRQEILVPSPVLPGKVSKLEFRLPLWLATRSLVISITDLATGRYLQPREVVHMELEVESRLTVPSVHYSDTGSYFMYHHPRKMGIEPDGKHYLMSFCMDPGTMSGCLAGSRNFSRARAVHLRLFISADRKYENLKVCVYQENGNKLRVTGGMGATTFV